MSRQVPIEVEYLVEAESKFDAAMARMEANLSKENFAELERIDAIVRRCLQAIPDSAENSAYIKAVRKRVGVSQ